MERLKGRLLRLSRSRLWAHIQSRRKSVNLVLLVKWDFAPHTSPTARNLPFGLMETLVTAFTLSREDQARLLLLSANSFAGEPLGMALCAVGLTPDNGLARVSGVLGGVD